MENVQNGASPTVEFQAFRPEEGKQGSVTGRDLARQRFRALLKNKALILLSNKPRFIFQVSIILFMSDKCYKTEKFSVEQIFARFTVDQKTDKFIIPQTSFLPLGLLNFTMCQKSTKISSREKSEIEKKKKKYLWFNYLVGHNLHAIVTKRLQLSPRPRGYSNVEVKMPTICGVNLINSHLPHENKACKMACFQ